MIEVGLAKRLEIQLALRAIYKRDRIIALLNSIDQSFEDYEAPNSDYRANLLRAIDAAVAGGWLLELMRVAAAQAPADDDLGRLVNELEPLARPAGFDHYGVCRLSGNLLMLNRSRLRKSVKTFTTPTSNRILVVQGNAQTGKTHTAWFISYLADALGEFKYHLIDLGASARVLGPGKPVEPDWVASKLVGGLRYQTKVAPAPKNGTWATWVLKFCDAFENEAREDPVHRWIVIDAFNAVVATQNTLDLVKELAVRVSQTLWHFRLFLLGFGTEDPPDLPVEAFAHLEKTERLGEIRPHEVIEFFARAFTQDAIPFDEDTVVATSLRVLEGLDPARADFLLNLTKRVTDELAKAAAGNGNG
jgi:hypothetical protein